jgi:hypothetical protein
VIFFDYFPANGARKISCLSEFARSGASEIVSSPKESFTVPMATDMIYAVSPTFTTQSKFSFEKLPPFVF